LPENITRFSQGIRSIYRPIDRALSDSLADVFTESVEQILDDILGKFVESYPTNHIEYDRGHEPVKVVRTPTNVINFPSFKIRTDQSLVDCRFCATVCSKGADSKIWSRYIGLENYESNSSVFTKEQLSVLYDSIEEWNKAIFQPMLLQRYIQALSTVKADISFSNTFNIEISTVSGDDSVIADYYDHEIRNIDISESKRIDEGKDLVRTVFNSMDETFEELPSYAESGSSDSDDISIEMLGIDIDRFNKNQRDSLKSIVAVTYTENYAKFYGIGYDPDSKDVDHRFSVSHLTSMDIGKRYAKLW